MNNIVTLCSFSNQLKRWGFAKVNGDEPLLFICEALRTSLQYLLVDDRTYQYGNEIDDPEKIDRGPYFIKQPRDIVYDIYKMKGSNDVSLRYEIF